MRPNHRTREHPHARGPIVWILVTLGAMALAAGCGKSQQPRGTCTNPSDTSVVSTNVTQEECTNLCDGKCTWTANES